MRENTDSICGKDEAATAIEFLTTASHEIRHPLHNIIGLTKILNFANSDEEREMYTRNLVEVSENLLELINDILDYNKLKSGKVKLNLVSTDLYKSIRMSLSSQQSIARMKGLDLIVNVGENIPLLLTDKVKINQVVLNLVSNALKFTSKGTILVNVELVHLDHTKAVVRFTVADTGIGIHKEKLDSVFEAFDQGDANNPVLGGTGLGLSISQKLVGLLGSEIEVNSEVGKGSEFTFTLESPIGKPSSELQEVLNDLSFKEMPGGLKGLVVDDDKTSLLVVQKYFDLWKIKFEAATDGVTALQKIRQKKYDFVLMDLNMPVMGGLEATEIIRNLDDIEYKKLPVVALTASGEEFFKENNLATHFSDVLQKPFHPHELYSKIVGALDLASLTLSK